MLNKHYEVELKAAEDSDPEGTIIAYASVFGNVDLVGDRVREGAFTKSLRKWREIGDPIPIILDHQWGDVHAHIGVANPSDVKQTKHGLLGKGLLDIKDNPIAAQVYKLLKRRSLKAFSFGYKVLEEELDDDGVNDLIELDLIEFGPTLKGANPEAGLVGVKNAVEALQIKGDDLRRRTDEAALDVATGGNRDRAMRRAADLKDDAGNLIDAMVDGMLLRFADLGVLSEDQAKSVWSAAYVNDLPDSAFLYIASGGDKDDDGKTTPRSLRYFPVRDADGKVDLPHVRNALARIPQANISDDAKSAATKKAENLLEEHGDSEKHDEVVVDDGDEDATKVGPEKNTGKRDDPLRRHARETRLALAMGDEPPAMPKVPKQKSVKDDEPDEPVVPGTSQQQPPIIIGGMPGMYQQQASLDEDSIVKAVMDKLGVKSVDPDEGEDGDDGDDDEKSLRRRTEQAARDLTREKLPPAAVKSAKALESEVREALANAGSERWGSDRVYVYLHDYDGDAKWAIYCVSANEIGGERKYVKVSYTIDSNGDAVLDSNEVEVEQHTTFDPVKAGPPQAPYGMPLVWLNHAGAAPDQEAVVKAVLDKLGKSDDDDGKSKRDPLRVRTEEAARELVREQMPPAAKSDPSSEETFDVDAIAEKVVEKLQERSSEVEKPNGKKSNGTTPGRRDPLREQTEREALDLALGRPAQDVPDIAQPEPQKEAPKPPDEKTLRRQTDKSALDLALGGFE